MKSLTLHRRALLSLISSPSLSPIHLSQYIQIHSFSSPSLPQYTYILLVQQSTCILHLIINQVKIMFSTKHNKNKVNIKTSNLSSKSKTIMFVSNFILELCNIVSSTWQVYCSFEYLKIYIT